GGMGSEINDIRNPRIMNDLQRLEEVLRENPDINSVFGAPDILVQAFGYIPEDEETIKSFFG
ncbi:MAG: hypothetical protein GTN39_03110, partial [Candidatus Aenigmarchaeota archaeon]|nr:hypothetical protein [Candidatus Aenigmarchaeota archaeon]